MTFQLGVFSSNPIIQGVWVNELSVALVGLSDVFVRPYSLKEQFGQIVFVDAAIPDLLEVLRAIDRRGRAVFLVVSESSGGQQVPAVLLEGKVDDVLVHPFRSMEVFSKLRHYQQILMWDEVSKLNASFSSALDGIREDLQLASSLQKRRLPVRFADIKGLQIAYRYMAGMRSGGDHFDLAEARGANQLSLVLSDSSSYGLSSAVLSALMGVALKLSADQIRSTQETIQLIHEEIALTLKEKDSLSLFYGVLSRKDFKLRYLNLGTSCAFLSHEGAAFQELPSQGPPITKKVFNPGQEMQLELHPEDRLILISDGFLETMGGSGKICKLLDQFRKSEPTDTVNELIYLVKSRFAQPDDLPEQDCTVVVFDVDPRVLRLAP
jgi:hypothetical protein